MSMTPRNKRFILWFKETSIKDVPLVGGKNASLGEMYTKLVPKGVAIPNGFSITASAYRHLLKEAGIEAEIKKILDGLDTHNIKDLRSRGQRVRHLIRTASFPRDLEAEILETYKAFSKECGLEDVGVAVRSSATAEDLPDASFAGQQETYLNVRGNEQLMDAVRNCFASLFTDRAISYRVDKHFSHFKIYLSIGVQRMVRSDVGTSGVMFTIDPESGFRDAVVINASWGLGEAVVQGAVEPDEFIVAKGTLATHRPIVRRALGTKLEKVVYAPGGLTRTVETSGGEREKFSLTDDEVLQYAKWGVIIEDHYKRPMDMEWAKDGKTGELFIVQARPETVQTVRDQNVVEQYVLDRKGKNLISGQSVGFKIGSGKVRVIMDTKHMLQFKKGEVLVTDMTDPDWEPIMKIASGIITDSGGRTSHAAIVSRELGIPCIVGTREGSKKLKAGLMVTVSCAEGEVGHVYEGKVSWHVKRTNIKKLKRPKTKILMNIASPDAVFSVAQIPNDGVGLAREEFIIASTIGIHPEALLHPDKVDAKTRNAIASRIRGYTDGVTFYVEKLAEGVGQIACAFYPRPVVVRFSDFKTNEYRTLIGGEFFEPSEENPMLGWRGASRYYDPRFEDAFGLECKAMKKVREVMGFTNVIAMIPFCRTPEEGKKVIAVMKKHGLERGKKGLKVYVMAEIPSNVLLVKEFAKVFDGFSVGSNDLTQLTMGVDRDSELVAHLYDERNPAIKLFLRYLIRTAHTAKRPVGICGQAPSDWPEIADFLVKEKIDSISLNPDSVLATTERLGR
ncbi:MAG: phosphoenolpyruvate synthase [bacterium]|nr:phosphoenolpyruvate synthase [bacterium]